MGEKVKTPTFRAAFVNHLWEAQQDDNGKPKFSVTMLFDDGADLSELKALAKAAAEEKWGSKLPPNLASPFRQRSEKSHLQGFGEAGVFINAKSTRRPGVVDARVQRVTDPEEWFSGCYARATVHAFAYEYKGKKGVSFGLDNVQFLRKGDRIDGGSDPEHDFEPESVEDDESPF